MARAQPAENWRPRLLVFVGSACHSKSADIFDEFRRAANQAPARTGMPLVSGDFDLF